MLKQFSCLSINIEKQVEQNVEKSSFNQVIYPQTATPDYVKGGLSGWYFPIKIEQGTTFQGLGFTIEFSTGNTAMNKSIIVIGSEYQSAIDFGLNFKENNDYITTSRHVKLGNKIGFFDTDSWNKNILKRNTNYVMDIQIDETRFRYSLYEKGFKDDIKYEYEFYGLTSSYLRQRLVEDRLSVAVNVKNYAVQYLRVYDLGYGIGVDPIYPKPAIRYVNIQNKNSGLYMRRYGTTGVSDYLTQAVNSQSANDMWRIVPLRQFDRKPNQYPVRIESMYKNTYIGPQNCSKQEDAYIYESISSDCDRWTLSKDGELYWTMTNTFSNGKIRVYNDSKSEWAYVTQAVNTTPISSKWLFEDLTFSPPFATGYYTSKVSASNKYMQPQNKDARAGTYIVQNSNDHSDAKVWYIELQPDGTYSIKNADTNMYLAVEGDAFAMDAYIIQKNRFDGYASEKWIIERDGFYYKLRNLASGKVICIRYDYLTEGEYFIQTSMDTQAATRLFEINSITYSVDNSFGGMYKLRNTHTGLYLAVELKSTQPGAYLRSAVTADTNSSWWTIERQDGGASVIRNVKSNMCVTVLNRNGSEGAYLVQEPINGITGSSLWHFHKSEVASSNIFFINNVFSGMTFVPQDMTTTASTYIVQRYSGNQDRRMRWELIPVSRDIEDPILNERLYRENTLDTTQEGNLMLNKVSFVQCDENVWNISSTEIGIKNISIISMNGRILKSVDIDSFMYQINLSSLSQGIYFISVKLKDGSMKVKKIKL